MDLNSDGYFDFEEIKNFFLNFCNHKISLKTILILFAKKLELEGIDTMDFFI